MGPTTKIVLGQTRLGTVRFAISDGMSSASQSRTSSMTLMMSSSASFNGLAFALPDVRLAAARLVRPPSSELVARDVEEHVRSVLRLFRSKNRKCDVVGGNGLEDRIAATVHPCHAAILLEKQSVGLVLETCEPDVIGAMDRGCDRT